MHKQQNFHLPFNGRHIIAHPNFDLCSLKCGILLNASSVYHEMVIEVWMRILLNTLYSRVKFHTNEEHYNDATAQYGAGAICVASCWYWHIHSRPATAIFYPNRTNQTIPPQGIRLPSYMLAQIGGRYVPGQNGGLPAGRSAEATH